MRFWSAVLAGVLLLVGGPAMADPGEQQRYYLVQNDDYLFQISADTLGDGNRYREIFDLNEGREQPGGGRLTDPVRLRAGWFLILPADAQGSAVRTGSPPAPDSGNGRFVLSGAALIVMVALLALLRRTRASRRPALAAVPAAPVAPVVAPPFPAAMSLTTPAGRLKIRMSGGTAPVHLNPAQTPEPPLIMPLELDGTDGHRIVADLAGAPAPITVTGRDASAHARFLAERLRSDGHTILVVGEVLGDPSPDWTTLPSMPASATELPAGTVVLICGGLRGPDLAAAHRLAEESAGRAVPMIVGDVLRGRWSFSDSGGAR
ncbi:MAG TPA: hypothetical protein VN408_22985 [Actinoplanes sp.]|nr:hypothetical protein [Actinoplanes sp.]